MTIHLSSNPINNIPSLAGTDCMKIMNTYKLICHRVRVDTLLS